MNKIRIICAAALFAAINLSGNTWAAQAHNPEVTGVTLEVENNLTNCMEERDLTFTAKTAVTWRAGGPINIVYILYIKGPTGSFEEKDKDWTLSQTCVFDEYTAPKVPRTGGAKSYTLQAYATAQDESKTYSLMTSSTLSIDVRRLWIDKFRDNDESKDWKVVIGRNIAFEGFASDDCASADFEWTMEDGVLPDAWSLENNKAKSGTDLRIPKSRLEAAGKNWFGDKYGTVTIKCKDGEGNTYKLDSTDMTPSKKAFVFFPADVSQKYLAPDKDNPPCWYVFWKNGAVPGLEDCIWKDQDGYGESDFQNGWWFFNTQYVAVCRLGGGDPSAPTGGHYLGGITINGIVFGGSTITGIDCTAEVIAHEKFHVTQMQAIREDGAADTDTNPVADPAYPGFPVSGDLLVDSGEAAIGCNVGLRDTFNVRIHKGAGYWWYGDGEYGALLAGNGKKGVANLDWSWKGKQW